MAHESLGRVGQVWVRRGDPEIAERLREHAMRNSFAVCEPLNKGAWRESTVMFGTR